jgi:putative transposase
MQFLDELKEIYRVGDAEFLVEGIEPIQPVLHAQVLVVSSSIRTENRREVLPDLYPTNRMIPRSLELQSGNAESWLTAHTAYYNHQRSHQALDNQPPVEALK